MTTEPTRHPSRAVVAALLFLTAGTLVLGVGTALSRSLIPQSIHHHVNSTELRNRNSSGADFGLIRIRGDEVWFVESATASAIPEGAQVTKAAWSLNGRAEPGGSFQLPVPTRTVRTVVGLTAVAGIAIWAIVMSYRSRDRRAVSGDEVGGRAVDEPAGG